MDPIATSLDFIVDDPRFAKERPFTLHISPDDGLHPCDPRLTTIRFEKQPVMINDMRLLKDPSISEHGFQYLDCDFSPLSPADMTTKKVERYQIETEEFLRNILRAEKVISYDCRFRQNRTRDVTGATMDINNPLVPDIPPRGVHNVTFRHGPEIIRKVLRETNQTEYLNKRYRYRIINTWRPMVPKLDDNPLTVCDYRSVDSKDLLACDNIYAKLRTDLYNLKYNAAQRWYWVSHQTPREVVLMLMYDTHPKKGARFCPHVSFKNPMAAPDAPMRESVETRSLVITLATNTQGK